MPTDIFIYGAIVLGIGFTFLGAVVVLRKRRKAALDSIARLEDAMMKSKDDPFEPARFVP